MSYAETLASVRALSEGYCPGRLRTVPLTEFKPGTAPELVEVKYVHQKERTYKFHDHYAALLHYRSTSPGVFAVTQAAKACGTPRSTMRTHLFRLVTRKLLSREPGKANRFQFTAAGLAAERLAE